jgi:hypothetical protein
MKLLFENWRKYLLTEAAKGPEDLPDNVYVRIRSKGAGKEIFLAKQTGMQHRNPGGAVSMMYTGGPGEGACWYAYMVNYSQADEGWGPMLYDVAMEVAGDSGLIADRDSLSDEAFAVWEYYMKNRSDVEKRQLDDMNNTLTQDEEDNCEIETALRGQPEDEFGEDDLYNSPVMKVYTKETSTIAKLDAMNRLMKD